MFGTDQPSAVSTLPTPAAAGTPGFFTGGNPATGQDATLVDADWLNMIQQELLNVLAAAGITPSKTTYTQVASAIKAIIGIQVSGIVGEARNQAMTVSSASSSATFTADELVVETALGGVRYCLPNFNKGVNLSGANGAGAMDAGSAPISGYVALYAIYNPTTQASALLATNATGAAVPNVYGGGNMPAGYTASALVSVWPTNSSGQFQVGYQFGRKVHFTPAQVLNTSTQQSSPTLFGISSAVPPNAKSFDGSLQTSFTTTGAGVNASIYGTSSGLGVRGFSTVAAASSGQEMQTFDNLPIVVPQTAYYTLITTSGASTVTANVSAYTF